MLATKGGKEAEHPTISCEDTNAQCLCAIVSLRVWSVPALTSPQALMTLEAVRNTSDLERTSR